MQLNREQSEFVTLDTKSLYGGDPVINVKQGEIYLFRSDDVKTATDKGVPSSPRGFFNPFIVGTKRVKTKCFKLCGTIGECDNYHFIIGLCSLHEMKISGKLYFFVNDSKARNYKYYNNNEGSFKERVTRIR